MFDERTKENSQAYPLMEIIQKGSVGSFDELLQAFEAQPENEPLRNHIDRVKFIRILNDLKVTAEQISALKQIIIKKTENLSPIDKGEGGINLSQWHNTFWNLGKYENSLAGVNFTLDYQ